MSPGRDENTKCLKPPPKLVFIASMKAFNWFRFFENRIPEAKFLRHPETGERPSASSLWWLRGSIEIHPKVDICVFSLEPHRPKTTRVIWVPGIDVYVYIYMLF